MVRCLSMVLSVVLVATSSATAAAGGNNGAVDEFQPRKVVPKAMGVVRHAETTGRLIVKFTDQAKSRSNADGTVVSRNNTDVTTANNIAKAFGLKFTRAINHSEQKLAALEARAAANSRRTQPDLAGILYLDGSLGSLNAAAVMLQQLPVVEYVEFEPLIGTVGGVVGACCLPSGVCSQQTVTACLGVGGAYQGDGISCSPNPCPPPPTGACCQPSGVCQILTAQGCSTFKGEFQGVGTVCTPGTLCLPGACCILGSCAVLTPPVCVAAQGLFQGIGSECADVDCTIQGCGESGGNCFTVTASPFCLDVPCCTIVCSIRPFCCDEDIGQWDEVCVQLANLVCDLGDRCETCLLNDSCYEAHPFPGCNNPDCCNLVAAEDGFCTIVEWDSGCVALATQLCCDVDPASTPNLGAYQGYLTPSIWPADIQPDLCILPPCPGPPFRGYCGEGYNLRGDGSAFSGLYGLGEQLLKEFGVGTFNGALGGGVNVGVIEFAAYVNHEDLEVIPEPGQTIITIPFLTEPDHGTACLGIIGARDDNAPGPDSETGVVGIAPECQLYFFPATSVEEGGRLFSAMSSAFQTFEAGDILSYSIGPAGGCGTLASGITAGTLLRVGTDLGIINVLAAGNSCCNLADDDPFADEALEAGCITVGAITPGRPYCRLGFSNFTNVGDPNIDVSAWGQAIATTGYGDLFCGGTVNRNYTALFGGTSGACPMVAGGLACLQGLAMQFYGTPLNAGQMKSIISFVPQCEVLDPSQIPGSPGDQACAGDFDADAEPNWVVGFFDPLATTVPMLATTPIFDGSPLIEDFFIRRGTLESGNIFSLKSADNNFLTIRPVRATPGDSGIGPGLAPTSPGPLLGFGLVTDIDVSGHTDGSIVEELELETRTRSTTSFTGIMFIEMYNWDLERYEFIDFLFVTPELPPDGQVLVHPVQSPERYISETDGAFIVRLWTVVPGNPSLTMHKIQHDFLGVTVNPGGGKG